MGTCGQCVLDSLVCKELDVAAACRSSTFRQSVAANSGGSRLMPTLGIFTVAKNATKDHAPSTPPSWCTKIRGQRVRYSGVSVLGLHCFIIAIIISIIISIIIIAVGRGT